MASEVRRSCGLEYQPALQVQLLLRASGPFFVGWDFSLVHVVVAMLAIGALSAASPARSQTSDVDSLKHRDNVEHQAAHAGRGPDSMQHAGEPNSTRRDSMDGRGTVDGGTQKAFHENGARSKANLEAAKAARPVQLLRSWDDGKRIETLNVRDADLRDVLRGIASRYDLNLVVDNDIRERVTVRLSDILVSDAVTFLCDEYGLEMKRTGRVLRVQAPPEPEPEPLSVAVRAGSLSVDLQNARMHRLARRLSQEGPANVVIGQGVTGTVSGYLEQAPFEEGLAALLENNGFGLHAESGIFTIVQPAQEDGTARHTRRSMNVAVEAGRVDLDVSRAPVDEVITAIARQMELELITYDMPEGRITAFAQDLALEEALTYLLRGTEVTYRKEGNRYIIAGKQVEGIASSRLIRLEHLKAETVAGMLPETLQQDAALKVTTEQNGVVVTGSSAAIQEIESFIREVDHPTPQILIEALVVDFNMNDLFDLGLRFGKGPAGTAPPVESDAYSFDEKGYELDASGERVDDYIDAVGETLQFVGGGVGESIRNVGRLPREFFVELDALSQEGKAEIKSRPQISTLNGHPASISIGTTQYFILEGSTPTPSGAGGYVPIQQERFEKIEANVTLDIVPWVTASGEVTVEIRPEFSMPVGQFSANVPPTINTRVLESTVRLKDGETIILGGLIQESKSADYTKVPLLGSIPLLGQLFRSRRHQTNKSELVIYLTPHVFYGGDDEAAKWDGLRDELGLSAPGGQFSLDVGDELANDEEEGRPAEMSGSEQDNEKE